MLTKLTIRNFKRFGDVEVELGNPVVFVGPNNSGKTSALQALTLWDIGIKRWTEKRGGRRAPETRPGVTVNRRDLLAIPHPSAIYLWRMMHVRDVRRVQGKAQTINVRINLVVEGVRRDKAWKCGLEFDYANEESFYCRPLRLSEGKNPDRMAVPEEAGQLRMAFLPPMSGLATIEARLDAGAVNVRIGEGRTAEILRNLCFQVAEDRPEQWEEIEGRIRDLFGAKLESPRYVPERGEITMQYTEFGASFDLSLSGRGLQQTLLLLAHMHANPGAVVLIDEPDAHLEILRQREIYQLITETAAQCDSQIIAASHSGVLLKEAAGRDLVIAFVGKPHPIGGRGDVMNALEEIGFDHYYQAEQTGWVLYLEGSTDLAILQAFARRLGKDEAVRALERPYVHYVGNQPSLAQRHFHGLREALPDLRGIALFDRLSGGERTDQHLGIQAWRRREIENYLCTRATLESYARKSAIAAEPSSLFTRSEVDRRLTAMQETVSSLETAFQTQRKGSPWSEDVKASDEVLSPLFEDYFQRIDLSNLVRKKQYHELVDHVPEDEVDPEIGEKLDAIASVARTAARLHSS